MTKEAMELKPCPFCGGEAEIINIDEGENYGGSCVCCTQCQASSNVEFERKENFVGNWNRRSMLVDAAMVEAAQTAYREGVYLTDEQVLASVTKIVCAALSAEQAQPVRWMLQETLPSGSIKWSVYEHEHHAQSVADNLPDCVVIPLYASPPAVPGEVERENAKLVELIKTRFLGVHPDELDCYLEYDDWTRIIAALSVPLLEIEGGDKGDGYQERVSTAHHALFHDDPTDVEERRARFFEEANEACQALGMTREEAIQLVDYTYDRPVGEPAKEVGAAMLTLTSLCVVADLDLMACAEADLEKLQRPETIARIRAKRSTRHGRGPLPGFDAAPSASIEGETP